MVIVYRIECSDEQDPPPEHGAIRCVSVHVLELNLLYGKTLRHWGCVSHGRADLALWGCSAVAFAGAEPS